MRCGPAPVKAVQNGDVFLGYDTKFIFAEVNGDRLTWIVTDEDLVPTNVDRYELQYWFYNNRNYEVVTSTYFLKNQTLKENCWD